MEKRARIATVAYFMAMSGRATLTDTGTNGAAGGTIATFIGHMKSIISKSNNSTGGLVLVFGNTGMLPKLTKDEFIVLNVVIVGGVLLIIISSYVLPRIAKAYWNYSKKLSQYIIIFGEKKIQNFGQIKNSRKIRSISKLGSKIFVPFKRKKQ